MSVDANISGQNTHTLALTLIKLIKRTTFHIKPLPNVFPPNSNTITLNKDTGQKAQKNTQ